MNPHDETYIGYAITDVSRLMRTVFERRVRASGLTRAQWLVIARLHRHPGLSQSQIADLLEIEKASAGRLIDRMQAKGWLHRERNPADRRSQLIVLSAEGSTLARRAQTAAKTMEQGLLRRLSRAERAMLIELLAKVADGRDAAAGAGAEG